MKQLHLSNSDRTVLVDDCNYEFLRVFTWRLKKSGFGEYVVTTVYDTADKPLKRINIRLHRLVLGVWSTRYDVHHKNGDIFDCTRKNLEQWPSMDHRTKHNRREF